MVGRANGVATYRNADFFGLVEGLNFALQYQGANEGQDATEDQEGTKNGHDDVRFQNGDGFGMSTSYDFSGDLSGLTLGAAYPLLTVPMSRKRRVYKTAHVSPAVRLRKCGPLARNMMPTAFIWR